MLDHPMELPSRNFLPRVYGVGAWTDNLPFAYDIVAALKPGLFVELGTDRGESYFGFCQSVLENKTRTRCFAVDTWRGDEHAGCYDETTFEEVSQHNAAHYAGFSTLLRSSFDDALRRFDGESIDLLHLDGLHTEEAVRHDLEAWLPKLRPGGILLMHDISVRARDFGVWKVWDELRPRGRSYAFTDGPGLGVWEKPPVTGRAAPLDALLDSASTSAAALADYYRSGALELQQRIAGHWRDGTIRQTAVAHQTTIQVFHTKDGIHREEDSVVARIGHRDWKNVVLTLPRDAGTAPLRLDFYSALTSIDIASIQVRSAGGVYYLADSAPAFDQVRVAGDAERVPHDQYLRVRITGVDPQLYLPAIEAPEESSTFSVRLKLRVDPDSTSLSGRS